MSKKSLLFYVSISIIAGMVFGVLMSYTSVDRNKAFSGGPVFSKNISTEYFYKDDGRPQSQVHFLITVPYEGSADNQSSYYFGLSADEDLEFTGGHVISLNQYDAVADEYLVEPTRFVDKHGFPVFALSRMETPFRAGQTLVLTLHFTGDKARWEEALKRVRFWRVERFYQ